MQDFVHQPYCGMIIRAVASTGGTSFKRCCWRRMVFRRALRRSISDHRLNDLSNRKSQTDSLNPNSLVLQAFRSDYGVAIEASILSIALNPKPKSQSFSCHAVGTGPLKKKSEPSEGFALQQLFLLIAYRRNHHCSADILPETWSPGRHG